MKTGWETKIIVFLAIGVVLVYSQSVLFPLLFSFFLYLLLDPIVECLVNIKCPRILASCLVIAILIGLITSTITFLLTPAADWVKNAPTNFQTLEHKFISIKKSIGEINKVANKAEKITETGNKHKEKVVTEKSNVGYSLFGLTTNVLLLIGTILLLVFFFLNYFNIFIVNLENILSKKNTIKETTFLYSLKETVSEYLFVFSLICLGLGIIVAIVFWILGMPDPVFFGFMATILTFVPYLGHFIGICITLLIAMLNFDSYLLIILAPTIYFLLALLEGQIITPILLGNCLNFNPLIIFLNMLIWSGLWGISGLVISIPILITIKIVLESVPSLSRFALLLEE